MGMYTEIYLTVRLREDIPEEALNVFLLLFKRPRTLKVEDIQLPDHDFFKCHRWDLIGNMSSYYFQPSSTSNMYFDNIAKAWFITSRSDLKNYDGEIAKFFNWAMNYFAMEPGEFIGYSRYEEHNEPLLYFFTGPYDEY